MPCITTSTTPITPSPKTTPEPTRHMTRLIASLMMALLILTGQQVSTARGSGPAVMDAVLCIGGSLMTVQLDADGNPVGPRHVCPKATLAFLTDGPDTSVSAGKITATRTNAPPHAVFHAPPTRPHLPPATGPPLAV